MSKLKKMLALALMIASAALLLMQALPKRMASMTYESSGREAVMPETELPDGVVSVNTADLDELMTLPGVGETLAQAIIDERESHGPFQYPEDLLSVRGIGEKTLEALRDWLDLTIGDDE